MPAMKKTLSNPNDSALLKRIHKLRKDALNNASYCIEQRMQAQAEGRHAKMEALNLEHISWSMYISALDDVLRNEV